MLVKLTSLNFLHVRIECAPVQPGQTEGFAIGKKTAARCGNDGFRKAFAQPDSVVLMGIAATCIVPCRFAFFPRFFFRPPKIEKLLVRN